MTWKKQRLLLMVIVLISGVATIFLNVVLRANHSLTVTILSIVSLIVFIIALILEGILASWDRRERKKT